MKPGDLVRNRNTMTLGVIVQPAHTNLWDDEDSMSVDTYEVLAEGRREIWGTMDCEMPQ